MAAQCGGRHRSPRLRPSRFPSAAADAHDAVALAILAPGGRHGVHHPGTENSIYRAFNFGADFTGAAGVYRRSWFLAGEFGFDKAVITHIAHTDWYRTHFYPEAKDGWYLNAGGTFHYAVTGGVAFGRTELAVRAGRLRTEDFNDLTPPMYAGVGVGFRF
ncbi:MAG TPA: hypothetical protein VGA20_01485 [Gemmatimonadales bacterium]